MNTILQAKLAQSNNIHTLMLFPAAVLLFILPFTGTIALRLTALALTLGIATWLWFRQPRPPLPLKIPLALWTSLAAASILWSVHPDTSIKEFRHEILFGLAAFFSCYVITRSQREIKILILALSLSATTMVILAIYNWLPHKIWDTLGRQGGVGTYSTYTLIALPWLYAGMLIYKQKLYKLPIIILTIALIASTYLTFNRIFWLTLAVQLIFIILLFTALSWKTLGIYKKFITLLMLPVILSATLITFVNTLDRQITFRFDHIPFANIQNAFNHDPRLEIWQKAGEYFVNNPISGHGFGREILDHLDKSEQHADIRSYPYPFEHTHAHNTFINYAIQLGIIGVLVLCFLLGALIWEFLKHIKHPNHEIRVISICMLALILGFLTKNMTDDFFRRDLALLFWASMGMSLGYIHWHKFRQQTADSTPTIADDAAR